jgi:hypothetical protein
MTACSAAGQTRDTTMPPTSPEAGIEGDAGANAQTALAPNTFLVHAATGVGDVRICFDADADRAQPSDVTVPQTNYPGLPVGGSVFFRNSTKVRGRTVTPFAVSASGLGDAEHGGAMFTCADLAQNPLINRIPIAPLPIRDNGPLILALVGTKTDLRFIEVYVGGTLPNDGIGAFVVNLSPSLVADIGKAKAHGRLGPLASPCSGMDIGLASLGLGVIGPAAISAPEPSAFDTEGFAVCNAANVALLARSYAELQLATEPRSLPAEHFARKADFVFAMVGDTAVLSGPEALHALAIPFEATK